MPSCNYSIICEDLWALTCQFCITSMQDSFLTLEVLCCLPLSSTCMLMKDGARKLGKTDWQGNKTKRWIAGVSGTGEKGGNFLSPSLAIQPAKTFFSMSGIETENQYIICWGIRHPIYLWDWEMYMCKSPKLVLGWGSWDRNRGKYIPHMYIQVRPLPSCLSSRLMLKLKSHHCYSWVLLIMNWLSVSCAPNSSAQPEISCKSHWTNAAVLHSLMHPFQTPQQDG